MSGFIRKGITQVSLGIAATMIALGGLSTEVLAQSKKAPTWNQRVQQGSIVERYVTTDYSLPPTFRNGRVYMIMGANWVGVYVLKSGLSSYPIPKNDLNEIDQSEGNRFIKSGKAIFFFWNRGFSMIENAKETEVQFDSSGRGCFQNTCLTAPYFSQAQIRRILLSERSIQNKSLLKTAIAESGSQDKATPVKGAKLNIQKLPNGNYFFGSEGDPGRRGADYIAFKKTGNLVTGYVYRQDTDGSSCLSGTVKNNVLISPRAAEPVFGLSQPGQSKWKFYTRQDLDLRLNYRIAFNRASDYDKKKLQECIAVLSKKR